MPNKNQNFKILLLNKGDSDIKTKIDQINNILETHKPHFLILNETQKHKNDNTSKFGLPWLCNGK